MNEGGKYLQFPKSQAIVLCVTKPKDIKINVNIKLLLLSVWANLSTILILAKDNPSQIKKQFLNEFFFFLEKVIQTYMALFEKLIAPYT